MEKKEITEILKNALNSGADFAELFWEQKETVGINCEENRIERINSGLDEGIGIRVIAGEKTSYAYTNDLSIDRLLEVAEIAGKGAQKNQDLRGLKDFATPPSPLKIEIKKPPQEVKIEDKVQVVLAANETARRVDQRIRQVTVNYGDVRQKVTIANSDGVYVEDLRTRTRLSVHAVASEGNLVQTGFHSVGGSKGFELLEEEDPTQIAETAAKKAILMLTAQPAPSGKMPVVLAGKAGGTMVHEACGHGLEADLVQKGLSLYADKRGQEVASPLITVVDDGLISGKFGTTSYDDEGTPYSKKVLINKGVLKNYMYDLITAKRDKVKSTGNGRRESYKDRPIPRMRNTYIASGKTDPEKIIKETKEGLLVTSMGGGQVNTLNGDYVFDVAEAYVLKEGKVLYPVRGATLTGNGPETLRLVDLVGKDIGFTIGVCGKEGQGVPVSDAQPTMAVRELIVGGTGEESTPQGKKIRRL